MVIGTIKNFLTARKAVVFVCFVGLFLAATTFFDVDFPWHLKYSTDILTSGIPKFDQYSYTMPSFQYVDHSLLSSIIFKFIYKIGGYGLVSIFIAGVATLGATLLSFELIWLIPIIASSYLSGFGVRAHVFSFFLTICLFKFTDFFFSRKRNMFLLLPLFMFLWSNLHGGFSLGIIYLWGYLLIDIYILERKRFSFEDKLQKTLSIQISTLATLFTPYGLGTWREAARTILSNDLRKYIIEWQPIKNLPSFGFVIIILLFFFSLYFLKKMRFRDIFTVYLLIQGILSVRFVPIFVISAVPTIIYAQEKYLQKNDHKIDKHRLNFFLNTLTVITVVVFVVECLLQLRFRTIIMSDFFPSDNSIAYIEEVNHKHVFTMASWGSYLNWKIPTEKSFIDGRMYVWIQEPKVNELNNAFDTYENIISGNIPYNEIFEKFCVDTILWHTPNTKSGWYNPADFYKFIGTLKDNGWTVIFEDSVSVVYHKNLLKNCY